MKATGAEIWAFYVAWPPGDDWYHDDYSTAITDDGTGEDCVLDLKEKYELSEFGNVCWQGYGKAVPEDLMAVAKKHGDLMGGNVWIPFEWWFRRWKGEQATETFVVTVKKEDVEAFRELCKQHKWKIAR